MLFDGLKVIDCASYIAAPAAATILSDFGAEVIKLEPPGEGDPYRSSSTRKGSPVSKHNYAWMMEARNKRSLAINLADDDAKRVLHRLVAQADVFITNFPFPVRKKLGLEYASLSALNERLIYASFSGYGETGDEMNKPGFDSTAWWARSGLMNGVRANDDAEPVRSLPGMGDHPCALSLFGCIMMALYRRERTGKGGEVHTSLMANGAWTNSYMIQAQLCGATIPPRVPRTEAISALTNHYRCRDGKWIMLSLLNEDRQWPLLLSCIEAPHIAENPHYATMAERKQRSRELIAELDHVFIKQDFAYWRQAFDRVGLVFGVVATLDDVVADRQMRDNDVFVQYGDSELMTVNSPFFVSGEAKRKPRMPPGLGQQTEEILKEAGFNDDEVARLVAKGAVAQA